MGYFLAGAIADFINTLNIVAIQQDKRALACLLSFLGRMVNFLVLYQLVHEPNVFNDILFYSLGEAVGTFLSLTMTKGGGGDG